MMSRMSQAPATSGPDANLVSLWQQYADLWRLYDRLPADWRDEQREPYSKMLDRLRDGIEALPAFTPAGMAVKLKLLFSYNGERWAEEAIFLDIPCESHLGDLRDRLLWGLIQDANRQAAAEAGRPSRSGANDAVFELYDIADAVAGMWGEVADCITIAARERNWTTDMFGPVDGLEWAVCTMRNTADKARTAVREDEERAAAAGAGRAAA